MFIRVLFSLIGLGIGYICLKYPDKIRSTTGKWEWAEKLFSAGYGTITGIKMIGILFIIISFVYVTGTHEVFLRSIVAPFQQSAPALTR